MNKRLNILIAALVLLASGTIYKVYFYTPAKDRFVKSIMALCAPEEKPTCQCIIDKTFEVFTEKDMEALEDHTAPLEQALQFMAVVLTATENCSSKEETPK